MSNLKPMYLQGALELKVEEAKLTVDVQTIGKQDPYCKISIGTMNLTTKVDDGAGKTPKWNQAFNIRLQGDQPSIGIEIYDKNMTSDTFIGSLVLSLAQLPPSPSPMWYEVYSKERKSVGQILIGIKVTSENGNPISNAPSATAPSAPVGGYPPQGAPGAYPAQGAPGAYPAQGAPGAYPAQGGYTAPPQGYAPQGYTAPPPNASPPQGGAQNGYPAQSGYTAPPQGYAPQQQGYAPQQQGYAPQQQTYAPPQGYPAVAPSYNPQPTNFPNMTPANNAALRPVHVPVNPGYPGAPTNTNTNRAPVAASSGYPGAAYANNQNANYTPANAAPPTFAAPVYGAPQSQQFNTNTSANRGYPGNR